MSFKKAFSLVLFTLLLVFSISNIYSGTVTYTDTAMDFYADMWYTKGVTPLWDSHIFENSFVIKGQLSTSKVNTITYPNSANIAYTQVIMYPKDSEDYVLKNHAIDLNTSNSGSLSITQRRYRLDGLKHLDTTSCNINSLSFDTANSQLTVTSNLQPYQVYDWNTAGGGSWYLATADFSNSDTTYFTDLLNKYYYMKSNVVGTISYGGSVIETLYEDDMVAQSTLNNGAGSKYINYSYIKPLSTGVLNFGNKASYLRLLQTYGNYGTYTFDFTVTPIDFKCDLNENNVLEASEYTAKSQTFTLQIRQPSTPTISSPANNAVFQGGSLSVTTTVSDPDANALDVYFLVDGTSVASQTNIASGSTITQSLTGLTDGYHNISVIASDKYTNVTSSVKSILMETPPVYASISANPANSSQYVKNQNYNFSIDWTDFNGISDVIFTFNGNTYTNFVKSVNTYTFTIPNLAVGNYLYSWFGNDTQSSSTTTSTYSYNVQRANPVLNLTLNGQSNNLTIEVDNNVSINANLITGDNQTTLQLYEDGSLINSGTSITNTTSYSLFNRTVNITVVYPQTQNFTTASKTYFVTTTDLTKPLVTNILPNGTSYEVGTTINISANVTDNYQVGSVVAQITYPNTTQTSLTLSNSVGNIYNNTFTIPLLKGTFNITIVATDHTGNVNNTQTSNFTTTDSTNPQVSSLIPTINTNFNTSDIMELSATVTDNVAVSSVIANLVYPNSTSYNYTLSSVGSNKFNTSFTIPTNLIGTYNITIIALDSSNNINNTQTSNFTVFDNINPTSVLVTPALNSNYYVTNNVVFSINSTDNIAITNVKAQLDMPNGTSTNYTLSSTNSLTYNYTYTVPQLLGLYNLTYIVTDSSNNVNNTIVSNFTVLDNVAPTVTLVSPSSNSIYNVTNNVVFSANMSDNIGLSSTLVQLDMPNGTSTNYTLSSTNSLTYNYTYTIPHLIGTYNLTYIAIDGSGNSNTGVTSNFTILDNVVPVVTLVTPTLSSAYNVLDNVVFSVNSTDNIAIANVKAQLDMPNGTSTNYTLSSTNSLTYNNTFSIPHLLGLYNLTFISTDSSGNVNSSVTSNFTVSDNIKPQLTLNNPNNTTVYNIGDTIIVNSTVTDNIGVDTVYATITYPNSTNINLSLINSGNFYNNTFALPLTGIYNITVYANDTSNNINNTQLISFNVSDATKPTVTTLIPTINTNFNISNVIELAANVTDLSSISSVIANLVYPNGTTSNITLNANTNKYNNSFTIPSNIIGTYNITIIATDSFGNVNNSEKTNFTVLDNVNPTVTALVPTLSSSFNTNDVIELAANVTDSISVQSVKAQLDMPNGTSTNYTLSANGNKYNTSFTVPTNPIGLYNITIIATDSSGNVNNSEKTNFTVSDNINPVLTVIAPVNLSTYNYVSNINLQANVTDNIAVSSVNANVTLPNSTTYTINLPNYLGAQYNNTYTTPVIGNYTIVFYTNDSSNNNVISNTYTITILDNTAPAVINTSPISGSNFNITNVIELAANVTDDIAVNSVKAIIDLANGTQTNVTLNANGNKYNASYTIPVLIGTYNVTYFANDSSNNVNNTQKVSFNVLDNIVPSVTTLIPTNGTSFNISDVIELAANVTDTIAVGSVKAIVDLSNGTQYNISLSNTGNKYNSSYTLPNLLGTHNITIHAVDSSGNINNSESISINVVDTYNPQVTNLLPTANSTYSTSNVITLSANVTDAIAVDTVYVNVAYPNGTTNNVTLSATGNTYNNTFTMPNLLGRYNMTIIANDTSNNINNSETTYFNVIDTTNPLVTLLTPNGESFNVTNTLVFAVNATDNIAVSSVIAKLNLPDSTSINYTLTSTNSITYNYTYSIPNKVGTYNITYIVTDSSDNVNNTITSNFTAQDFINPTVSLLMPTLSSTYNVTDSLTFGANVADNVALSSVKAQLDMPNGTSTNYTLSSTSLPTFNVSYTIPQVIGLYNLTFIATDSSGNVNNSVKTNFTVLDNEVPLVSNLLPVANTTYNMSDVIQLAGTVTDNIAVGTVIAQVSYPNSTKTNVTLTSVGSNKYNNTFTIPVLIGRYNVTIYSNDTSGNTNNSETSYFNAIDNVVPSVTALIPNSSASFTTGSTIEVAANVTDTIAVGSVIAQLTYPNSTTTTINLANAIGAKYNNTFTLDQNQIGNYTLRIIANDTTGNVNSTETTTFAITDITNPNVTLITPINGTYNVTGSVLFSVTATDNIAISTVKAQVDLPDNTAVNYTLVQTGNTYNYTYTIPLTPAGVYNITIFAIDSSGNVNNSVTGNFTVLDNVNPTLTLLSPNGETYNVTNSVVFGINVADNMGVSSAKVQLDMPNGTSTNYSLATINTVGYNYTYTIPQVKGLYNLTYFVYDSSSNVNDSVTSNFTVLDNVAPVLTVIGPANLTVYNYSSTIDLIANATDNIGIDSVNVNITLPNSSVVQKSLINSVGNTYNNTYSTPTMGTYTLVYYINDTSGNNVVSNVYTITVNDVNNPVVTNITPTLNSIYNISDVIELGADITDDIAVSTTLVQMDMPNGTSTNYTLVANGNRYNYTYTIPQLLGLYNLTYYTNDSSGNTNNSVTSNFTVHDIQTPNVSSIVPISNSTFNVSDVIEIYSTITDNLAVTTSLIQIDMPNGTSTNYTLTNVGSNKYNVSYTIPNVIGRYNVTFIANDSSNNINTAMTTYFNAIDTVTPIVNSLTPSGNNVPARTDLNVQLNITENVGLNPVIASISYPNGTQTNVTLTSSDNVLYNNTFTVPTLTGRYNITFTTIDTSSNSVSNSTYFTSTLPNITNSSIDKTSVRNDSNVGILINAVNASELYANVTMPDSSVNRLNLTNGISTLFSNVSIIGDYSVLVVAKDSANNIDTASYNFTVFDTVVFNSTITGLNGSTPNGTYTIIYNGTTLESGNLNTTNFTQNVINALVDTLYTFNGGELSIKFNGINMSQNVGKYFKVDRYDNVGGYLRILGVNTSYIFTTATVTMTYDPTGVSNENNLKLYYCSNYNFESRTCNVAYTDVTSGATLDTTNNKIIFTANGFSAYAIKEVTPVSNNGGGGGGGSSSSTTTNTAPVTTPTDVVTVTPQDPTIVTPDTCTNDWVCTEWSPNVCPISGIQTRSCTNYGTCSGTESKPTEERTCSTLVSKNVTLSPTTTYNVGVGVDEIVVNFSLSDIITAENLKVNDTITIVYQIVDLATGEIVKEVVEATKITETGSISKSIDTRDLPQGNYEVKISAIANSKRYLSEGSSVTISGKDAYVDPLTGNIIVGNEFSWTKLVVGVLAIGAVFGLGYLGYMYQSRPRNYRRKKVKFDWLKKK